MVLHGITAFAGILKFQQKHESRLCESMQREKLVLTFALLLENQSKIHHCGTHTFWH